MVRLFVLWGCFSAAKQRDLFNENMIYRSQDLRRVPNHLQSNKTVNVLEGFSLNPELGSNASGETSKMAAPSSLARLERICRQECQRI